MEVKYYWCPHCESRFRKLCSQCPSCKRELSTQLLRQLATLETLRQTVSESFQQGVLDSDFYTSFNELCTTKSDSLLRRARESRIERPVVPPQPRTTAKAEIEDEDELVIIEDTPAGFVPVVETPSAKKPDLVIIESAEAKEVAKTPPPQPPDKVKDIPVAPISPSKPVPAPRDEVARKKRPIAPTQALPQRKRVAPTKSFASPKPPSQKATVPVVTVPPKPPKKTGPPWYSFLFHPAVKENVLLFLGALLIMIGEVFVVSNAWSRSDTYRLVGIYTLLASSSLLFFFLGRFAEIRLKAETGGMILYIIALFLLPWTFATPAHMFRHQALMAVALTAVTAAGSYFLCRRMGTFFHPQIPRAFTQMFLPLSAVQLLVPFTSSAMWMWRLLSYLTASFALVGLARLPRAKEEDKPLSRVTAASWIGLLLMALGEYLLHAHYWVRSNEITLAAFEYAPMVAAIALLIARLDFRLFAGKIAKTAITPLSITAICTAVFAATIATGSRYSLLLTGILVMVFFAQYTIRFRRHYFFLATLAVSIVVYFLLPLPIRELLLQVRAWLGDQLGYAGGKLPYSYYGITFLPYLIGLCFLGRFLQKRDESLLKPLQAWFLLISVGLLGLVKLGGTDVRAPLATLPVYGIGYFFAIRWLRLPVLSYFSLAIISFWVYDLGVYCQLSIAGRVFLLLGLAMFWYSIALVSRNRLQEPVSETKTALHKALLDTFAVVTMAAGGLALWHWQHVDSLSLNLAFVVAGILFFLMIFVYQSAWLWIPTFALGFAGVLGAAAKMWPDNPRTIAYASMVWAYAAVAIGGVLRYWLARSSEMWFAIRPGVAKHPSPQRLLFTPLLYLLPVPVAITAGLLTWQGYFTSPDAISMAVFLALTLLTLAAPAILGVSSQLRQFSPIPFAMAIIPIVYTLSRPEIDVAFVGALLYTVVAIYLASPAITACAVGGITLSLLQWLRFQQVPDAKILCIFAAVAIVWFACEILLRRKRTSCARVFAVYSLVTGGLVATGVIASLVMQTFYDHATLGTLILLAVVSLLHFVRRPNEVFLISAFATLSGTVALATEFAWPGKYPLQSVSLAVWGAVLYIALRAFSRALSRFKIVFPQVYTYPTIVFAIAYGLASYYTSGETTLSSLPLIAIALCAGYFLALAAQLRKAIFAYIFAFIANHALFSGYFVLVATAQIEHWPLLQAAIGLLLFVVALAMQRWRDIVSLAVSRFCAIVTVFPIVFITTLRALRLVVFDQWTYTPQPWLNLYTAAVAVALFAGTCRYLRWRPLVFAATGSGLIVVIFLLDGCHAIPALYPLSATLLAFTYALLAIFRSSVRPQCNASSIIIALLSVVPLPFLYMAPAVNQQTYSLIATTLFILSFHALFMFAQKQNFTWIYLGLCHFLIAVYACVFVKIAAISPHWMPVAVISVLMALLVLAVSLGKRQFSWSLNGVEFTFRGDSFATAVDDTSSLLLGVWLLIGFVLWAMSKFGDSPLHSFSVYFVTKHRGLLLTSLSMGVVLSGAIAFFEKNSSRSTLNESLAILFGAEILLITAPMAGLLQKTSLLGLADLDWALYGLLCCVLGYYLRRSIAIRWGAFFSVLSLIGAGFSYTELSSICAIFTVALNLLIHHHIYSHSRHDQLFYFGYWAVFLSALGLLANHLWLLPEPTWYVQYLPHGLLLLAIQCALLSRHKQSSIYWELAHFTAYIALLLLAGLAYTTPSPAALEAISLVFIGAAMSAFVLWHLGRHDSNNICYYLLQLVAPGLYAFLRMRTHGFDFVDGLDGPVVFLLFALLPQIYAFFSKDQRLRLAINDFALVFTVAICIWDNAILLQLPLVVLYSSMLTTLLTLRLALYFDGDEQALSFPTLEGIIVCCEFATLALAGGTYFAVAVPPGWTLSVAGILLGKNILDYALRRQSALCFYCFVLMTITVYVGIGIDYLHISPVWHPLWLLLAGNLALASGFSPREFQFGKVLKISGRELRTSACRYAAIILSGVLVFAVLVSFSLLIDFITSGVAVVQNQLTTAIGNHHWLIWISGILAIATALHIRRLANWETEPLWIASAFFTLALTAPLGHLLHMAELTSYCSPSVEFALFALVLWWFAHSFGKPAYHQVGIGCALVAILCTKANIDSAVTFITLFVTAFHLLCASLRGTKKMQRPLFWLYAIDNLVAIYFLIFFLLPRRGSPPAMVLPLLSVVTTLLAFVLLYVGPRIYRKFSSGELWEKFDKDLVQISLFFSWVATAMVAGAVFLITQETVLPDHASYSTHVVLSIASLAALAGFSLDIGRRTGRAFFYYQFQAVVVTIYYLMRYRTSWIDFLADYDPHVLLVFAITFYQIGVLLQKTSRETIARTFYNAGYWMPLLTIIYSPWQIETTGSSLFLLCAVHFGFIYLFHRQRLAMLLSLICWDLTLYQYWRELAIVDPQFYGIPLGITLIALGELNREELQAKTIQALRIAGLVIIYGSSATQMLLQLHSPMYSIVLGALAFLGILIGIWRNNNLYIYIAGSFLILDILAYFVKYGIEHGILQGVLLVLAGVVILGMALYFHLKRRREEEK